MLTGVDRREGSQKTLKMCRHHLWIFPKPIFYLFPKLRKIEKPINSSIQKSQSLFVNWKKLGTAANFCPNLSFNVENK